MLCHSSDSNSQASSKPLKPSPLGTNAPLTDTNITDTNSGIQQPQNSPSFLPVYDHAEYPNKSSWPPWIFEAVRKLDIMSDKAEWKQCVTTWLEMEHRLGYLTSMVSLLIALFLVATNELASLQKKEHKLNKEG
jgi:hypothetical protein